MKSERFNGFMPFHNLVVILFMFVEPISNILATFTDQGRHLVDSFVQWIQTYLERFRQHGKQGHICKRERSRDLKSVQFLGQGLSGFNYETTWSSWNGKKKLGRFARKDFPGVESEAFENEAARLMNLSHPNVVKAFCWTVDRLGCSLVLEFVSNDLQSVVEKRMEAQRKVTASRMVFDLKTPFEITEAIYIMLHIAIAMEYLHSKGVAHGDLRPNNVLVDLEADPMIVKVVDFGLIESKKRTTLVSKRAQFLRTLEWKAPETFKDFPASFKVSSNEDLWEDMDGVQAEGSLTAADELADVYSFAITCSYIMGGKVSYPKSTLTKLQQNISSGTLRPEIPVTCSSLLSELIRSSWDSDPERRPRFFQIRKELENLQQQETARGKGNFSGKDIVKYTPKIRESDHDHARKSQVRDVSKHKVYLSHSGAQKAFVERLCVDLEKVDRHPFCDRRSDSRSQSGVYFPTMIFEAISQSCVAVVILSEEFICSKWSMLELTAMVEFRNENPSYIILPVFLGISPEELEDPDNHQRWLSLWAELAKDDGGIIREKWMAALSEMFWTRRFVYNDVLSEVRLRAAIVETIVSSCLQKESGMTAMFKSQVDDRWTRSLGCRLGRETDQWQSSIDQ